MPSNFYRLFETIYHKIMINRDLSLICSQITNCFRAKVRTFVVSRRTILTESRSGFARPSVRDNYYDWKRSSNAIDMWSDVNANNWPEIWISVKLRLRSGFRIDGQNISAKSINKLVTNEVRLYLSWWPTGRLWCRSTAVIAVAMTPMTMITKGTDLSSVN